MERRATDTSWGDTARILAILYTLVFAAMVYGLFEHPIPADNEATINQLVGIMSAIQLAIIGFYFGGSKSAVDSQKLIAASKERSDATAQDVAKIAAAAVAATSTAPAGDIKAEDVTVKAEGDVTVERK